MKKILCFMLAVILLFSICACKDTDYPPVESTEQESAAVMTFEANGSVYEVRYELYRALFLTFAPEYDGGDKSFWDSEQAAAAKIEINSKITRYCADIYSTIHHAKMLGLDPYSSDAEEMISEYIKDGIEGNDEEATDGFGGDYEAYLTHLYEMNLNYSVQVLILRYSIAYNSIINYYKGTVDEENPSTNMTEGALKYTKDDVYKFYNSDDCVRVSVIEINSLYMSPEKIQERRDKIASYESADAALSYAVQFTAGNPKDILDGVVIGTHSMDDAYYAEVTKSAFALAERETSQPIEVNTESSKEYWILYKQSKNDKYFNEYYADIESVYVAQVIGETLLNVKNTFLDSVKTTAVFEALKYSEISMVNNDEENE